MHRWTPEGLSGVAMLVVSVVVGGPVLFGAARTEIPRAVWIVLFGVLLVALFAAAVTTRPSTIGKASWAVAVVAAWAVVLTAPEMGLLPILLVVVAAVSVYVVPVRIGLIVVALNTLVIGLATAQQTGDAGATMLTGGFYLLIQLATVFSSVSLLREQRMRRELTEAHVELQAATVLLSESARTAERLRISRDLHDLIGHQLTVLALELETARHRDGERAREHVERANRVARELLADVRSTVGELRVEPLNLAAALEQVVRDLPGLDVQIDVAPDVDVGEEHAAAFVRAVQEIVTNVLRHADARVLRIEISSEGGGAVLSAVDDGAGTRKLRVGNGLRGMAERFEALGGHATFDGNRGFRVRAWVPAS
ncbi:histidine kinase [Rhodococcus sp. SMB37]|uniref:sensor histidine kinase n=1 Tax=Rhodococcus sp. SMB37 TaxID=2512213 RepID=UPI0018EE6748|nr:histidine kinase [Rhodococcus sp. SMB37]